ncbi:MAG: magnesium transporter [Clostridia bacterium]|jgi:magnesium transporter|nr:magnesium transporter [Clostridia bacterium]MCI2000221.1 magnesium transporter [Clostridia bacterium]MCI2014614.1 magnesium transporter [Clostridia bacterium]
MNNENEKEKEFEQWLKMLDENKFAKLKYILNEENPANIAEFFEDVPKKKRLFVFRLLTKDNAAETFSFMASDVQEDIVNSITDNEVRSIVDEMSVDDAVDFLGEMPANLITKILKNTSDDKRKVINEFLNYPEDSAGSIMTIEFVEFHVNSTVAAAMDQLRKNGVDKETIYSCYVVDKRRVLVGMVSLRTLILSSDDTLVSDIMEDDVISVQTLDDQEEVANIFKKYNLIALPVVDKEKRLVGIITVDDIVDVMEEETTEDIEKMSALLPSDDEYLKTSVGHLAKNRIIWLLVLMISGTFSSAIISGYQSVLESSVLLASFIPILMDTGGNAGSQASTLIIRGMAVGEIGLNDILKVIWKELRVGIICGVILSAVNFVRLMIISDAPVFVNLTVSLSICVIVILSKTIGCVLPMVAKKLKLDPAIMAGPLITTVVDSVSLIIFFNFAKLFVLGN